MLGIIYLFLAGMLGYETSKILTEEGRSIQGVNRIWLILPASFGIGTLLLTWAVYVISWFFSEMGKSQNPLLYGNTISMVGAALILIFAAVLRYKKNAVRTDGGQKNIRTGLAEKLISNKKGFKREVLLFGLLAVFITYMMFYVFYIRDGVLYSGLTVYGDYAPHTAMMRSFSMGNNFPTQYPHYGGADVKYHFMFQFLTGNLEYLGLRMDIAYNIVSSASLVGFLMLLYQLALRITGKISCGAVTIFLFFFRSGMSFFRFVWEHIQTGDLLETLSENVSFIGYTTNENWGLWNFNVYLNQRHLAFGLLIVSLVIWLFMDWLDIGCAEEEKGIVWLRNRFFTKKAWKCICPENALMAGMFLGLTSFWNGAAVIGGLLILLGFAVFSDGKLDYLIFAATSVIFSVLQTRIFIWGEAVSPSLYWGFLSDDKTLWGVLWYLIQMSGIFFVGAVVLVFLLKKRQQRAALISFLFPAAFAFFVSLTPDIAVNHKYIMISYAFTAIFWAWALMQLFRKKILHRIVAVLLAVCMTITGIYDFVVIIRNNGPGHRVSVNMNSDLTDWLEEHLTHEDLILTPEYSINEVTMSGVMMYMGWPYYAWSAGYDTNYRAAQAVTIYTTMDSEELKKVVKQERITYILFEEGSEFEQQCVEDRIAATYEKVYETEDGRIRIYKTSE
mgnify:CR=1 FL=1